MRLIRTGYTRDVALIGQYAVKLPTVRNGWRAFIMGILGNIEENARWQHSNHPGLAPVLFSFAGMVNIYPRYDERDICTQISHEAIKTVAIYNPDPKPDNYACIDGDNLIVLDYGHHDAWIKEQS